MNIIPDKNVSVMKRMLDYSAKRQQVISNNLANVDTPGYKRSDIKFMDEFRDAVAEGTHGAILNTELQEYKTSDTPVRNDGNNVDIDREMALQTKNGLLFKTFAALLARKYRSLREAAQTKP